MNSNGQSLNAVEKICFVGDTIEAGGSAVDSYSKYKKWME